MGGESLIEAVVGEALRRTEARLAARGVPSARLTAEVLLAHVLGVDKAVLYAHPDQELGADRRHQLEQLIEGRCEGVPTQYLTGVQEFFGLEFEVTPDVLIPRPETEHLVEEVLEIACPGDRLVDVGTGSGCIAISVKKRLPSALVAACDVSRSALGVAERNAGRHRAAVHFFAGDLADAARPRSLDLVVSNPPYVPLADLPGLQRELRAEPATALFGGEDGLAAYRRLAPQAAVVLKPGGRLLLELGYHIRPSVEAMLPGDEWEHPEVKQDLAGLDRVLTVRKR